MHGLLQIKLSGNKYPRHQVLPPPIKKNATYLSLHVFFARRTPLRERRSRACLKKRARGSTLLGINVSNAGRRSRGSETRSSPGYIHPYRCSWSITTLGMRSHRCSDRTLHSIAVLHRCPITAKIKAVTDSPCHGCSVSRPPSLIGEVCSEIRVSACDVQFLLSSRRIVVKLLMRAI